MSWDEVDTMLLKAKALGIKLREEEAFEKARQELASKLPHLADAIMRTQLHEEGNPYKATGWQLLWIFCQGDPKLERIVRSHWETLGHTIPPWSYIES